MDCISILSTYCKEADCFYRFLKQLPMIQSMQFILIHCNKGLKNIVAFILLVILVKLILYLIIVTFDKIVAYKKLHLVSRIMGVILGILMSLIVIQIGLYLISLYPDTFIQNQISQSLLCKRWILNMPFVSHFILNL